MTIDELAKLVEKAEIEANERADRARSSLTALKQGAKDAATPWRIVGVGAITGFLAGRSKGGAGGAGMGGMFSSLAQALITTLGASATAGMAASTAADAAAAATVDATLPPTPVGTVGVASAATTNAVAAAAVADAPDVGALQVGAALAANAGATHLDDDEALGAALARTASTHSADVADER
jgi:hypothetical protein